MYSFTLKLSKMVKEHGVDIVRDLDARADLQAIQTNFNEYSKFFYQVVK